MADKGKKKTKVKVETEKIVIDTQDELIDLIKKIEETKANKVILTFTDPSDILISPINLKVLQETADETGVLLVAQIVQNPTGIRNARTAGMVATDATGSIMQAFWDEADHNMRGRIDRKKSMLKKTNGVTKAEEEIVAEPEPEPTITEEERTKFQKRISEALERSKAGLSSTKQKVLEHGGVVIGLDQDVSEVGRQEEKPSLIGKDIGFMKEEPMEEEQQTTRPRDRGQSNGVLKFFAGLWLGLLAFPPKVGAYFAKAGTKVILIRIVAPLFIILILGLWLAYTMLPLVRIKMYIESKPVSVEKVFSGDTTVTSFDFEKGSVPVKKEEVEKSGSDNTNATGTAYRGEKAQGVVRLTYYYGPGDEEIVTVPEGTTLTTTASPSGLKYVTTIAVTINASEGIFKDVAVQASEVGEQYNISSGNLFTVSGFAEDDLTGTNTAAMSGGNREQYTVFSKKDRDDVVKDLKEDAFNEAEDDLRAEATDGWELIESTIKSEVDGDPETDVPVGAEADIVNVSIKTKSSALYYRRSAIEDEIERVLTEAASDQDLFESSTDAPLELDQDVEQTMTVEEVKGETVKIKLIASSRVKPEIKREDIIEQLKGKSWEEGLLILEDLSFATKPTETEFAPSYFPMWARNFPGRQGRILITIIEEDTTSD